MQLRCQRRFFIRNRGETNADYPAKSRRSGRPKAADSAIKKEEILRVATGMFLNRGYREVTTRMVAEGANVSRQTLFNLYKDKAMLFQACLDFASPVYPSAIIDHNQRPDEALPTYAVELIRWLYRENSIGFSRLLITDGRNIPELSDVAMANNEQHFIKPLADYLNRYGLEEEGFPNARLFIYMTISRWMAQLSFGRLQESDQETAAHAKRVTEIFLNGVTASSGVPTSSDFFGS